VFKTQRGQLTLGPAFEIVAALVRSPSVFILGLDCERVCKNLKCAIPVIDKIINVLANSFASWQNPLREALQDLLRVGITALRSIFSALWTAVRNPIGTAKATWGMGIAASILKIGIATLRTGMGILRSTSGVLWALAQNLFRAGMEILKAGIATLRTGMGILRSTSGALWTAAQDPVGTAKAILKAGIAMLGTGIAILNSTFKLLWTAAQDPVGTAKAIASSICKALRAVGQSPLLRNPFFQTEKGEITFYPVFKALWGVVEVFPYSIIGKSFHNFFNYLKMGSAILDAVIHFQKIFGTGSNKDKMISLLQCAAACTQLLGKLSLILIGGWLASQTGLGVSSLAVFHGFIILAIEWIMEAGFSFKFDRGYSFMLNLTGEIFFAAGGSRVTGPVSELLWDYSKYPDGPSSGIPDSDKKRTRNEKLTRGKEIN
jgi:hypothetical protein